jgi:hypothetical protein
LVATWGWRGDVNISSRTGGAHWDQSAPKPVPQNQVTKNEVLKIPFFSLNFVTASSDVHVNVELFIFFFILPYI